MKRIIQSILFCLIVYVPFATNAQTVKNLARGTAFTCVSYDAEGNVWAGTYGQGLWKGKIDTVSGKITGLGLFSTDANFNKYQIQTVATPTINGRTSVWVGSRGTGGGSASGGGVHQFLTTSTTKAEYFVAERDKVVAKGMKVPAMKNDGTPSRDCKSIAVDKNGTVWSAHGYHDLLVTGTVEYIINPYTYQLENYSVKGGYYVTPGGLGMKKADKPVFDNRSNLDEKKYPAYTIDTPIEKTAQTRMHLSVGTGNDQVWVSVGAFEDVSGNISYTGIIKYDLGGNFYEKLDYTTTSELPFTNSFASPRAYSIHFQKNDTPWLTFNQNKGFAVMENFGYTTAKWVYVAALSHYNKTTGAQEVSTMFANGIPPFNLSPGLIASSGRRVFLGTTAGLLVYDGHGDIRQDSSYTLITTAEGLSSNDIKGVTTGAGYVYVATSQGIDQVFIPSDITIIHIDRKEAPFESKDQNYIEMSTMTTLKGMNNISYNQDDLPMFSADGTTSSVFRYYTDDFDGFYQQEEKYLFGLAANFRNEDTAKYGKFILKPVEAYEDDKKEYVDIIYRHPLYVDQAFVQEGKDAVYDFRIVKKNATSQEPLFRNHVKITLPPVLLVHGVWSNTRSLESIENALQSQGSYLPFKVLKIYKTHEDEGGNTAEYLYSGDKDQIPNGIKKLITTCAENNLSAGRVSLVVHSRGGLYARAYIEELEGVKYNFDIHALITLNTPHAGSQLANLVLDERTFTIRKPKTIVYMPHNPALIPMVTYETEEKKLGDVFSFPVPSGDLAAKNGAKVLQVDKGFIMDLNNENNLKKLAEYQVPIHAVATEFKFCKFGVTFCDLPDIIEMEDVGDFKVPKSILRFNKAYATFKFFLGDLPTLADDFIAYIFQGETNDFIVPKSSMEAGLSGRYLTTMHELNIAHTTIFEFFPDIEWLSGIRASGVTSSSEIQGRIIELLGQNVFSTSSSFTRAGINPPKLKYDFLPVMKGNNAPNNARISTDELPEGFKFYIDRSDSLKNYRVGDSLTVRLMTSGIDKVMLSYETVSEGEELVLFETRTTLADTNTFVFRIPEEYQGNFTIIAYGFKNNTLYAMDQIEMTERVPENVSLTDIYFNGSTQVIELLEMQRYTVRLSGLYSDSISRNLTTNAEVSYHFTDSTMLRWVSDKEVQALKTGFSYLIAVYKNKIDSLQFVVYENPNLQRNIIGDFYVSVNEDKELFFDWTMLQSYRCKQMDVEHSSDGINFSPLFTVPGNGTSYQQVSYSFSDVFDSDSTMYYRVRVVDSTGLGDTFSQIRTIVSVDDVTTLVEESEVAGGFQLYPNPSSGGRISISFQVKSTANSSLNIRDVQGRLVANYALTTDMGTNAVSIELPAFIAPGFYTVQLLVGDQVYSKAISINK